MPPAASAPFPEREAQMEDHGQEWTLQAENVCERIAAGMASLRAGEGVDGDTFLAVLDAELAELEPHAAG